MTALCSKETFARNVGLDHDIVFICTCSQVSVHDGAEHFYLLEPGQTRPQESTISRCTESHHYGAGYYVFFKCIHQ